MNFNFIAILVLNQLLNILFMFLVWRYLKPRLRGDTGPTGTKGDRGLDGKSAYVLAREGGYRGTPQEFNLDLASIAKKKVKYGTYPHDKAR